MPTTHLLALPSEILEIVVVSCASEHPQSIAALALTCRRLRTLIYDTTDSHLWRNLFLTTFDDPRLSQSDALGKRRSSFLRTWLT